MKYEDDLRYASEAIQAIAYDAMQRIERLYSLRFQSPEPTEPEISKIETYNEYADVSDFNRVEVQDEDPRFQFTQPPNRSQYSQVPQTQNQPIPQISIAQRPEKIDSNLHGLEL